MVKSLDQPEHIAPIDSFLDCKLKNPRGSCPEFERPQEIL